MQAAGNLVGILVEFAARMSWVMMTSAAETPSSLWMSGRDAAPVVGHGAGAVGIERYGDERGMSGQCFVDGVVLTS